MFIRQVPDLNCEQIKNALQDINQRLNYLQSRMPHENSLIKDPIIPKLDLSRLGIQENNYAASKIEVPKEEIKQQKQFKEIAKRNRSASFNFSNQPIMQQGLKDKTNCLLANQVHSQQVSQKNLKPPEQNPLKFTKDRHITPQHSASIKFVQQPSRNSTPLKTSLEIIQKQMEKQMQNQQFVKQFIGVFQDYTMLSTTQTIELLREKKIF